MNKKNALKNLENFRSIFFMLGLALSLGVITEIIQYQSVYKLPEFEDHKVIENEAGPIIPITFPDKPEKPEPKVEDPEPDPIIDPLKKLKIVDNTEPIDISKMEVFRLDSIPMEPIFMDEKPEIIEAVLVENMARPKVCEDLKGKDEQMECFNSWIAGYIAEEIEFPSGPFRNSERIFVEFIIDRSGQVQNVGIIRGEDPDYRQEAKRVIESLPALVPASQMGRTVPVRVRIPVNFKIR